MVVQRCTDKLSSWKCSNLSMVGRLTLVRLILNSLPLYFFIFRAPSSLLKKLENTRNKFLWGACGPDAKLIWASNAKVYGDYSLGGLKVGSLKEKNLALIGKWWWRFLTERESVGSSHCFYLWNRRWLLWSFQMGQCEPLACHHQGWSAIR